jgi:hypothetical protein
MKWQKVIYYTDNSYAYDLHHKIAPSDFRRKQFISVDFWKLSWLMVAVSCLSINGFYLWYAKHFFGGSRKLKIFLLFYTLSAVKPQIVWLVCKNQYTVTVQNFNKFFVESEKCRSQNSGAEKCV